MKVLNISILVFFLIFFTSCSNSNEDTSINTTNETVLVEVPSEDHPFGVRGVGETPICPPVPAISNAVNDAIGTRILSTPIKASKILNTLKSL